MFRRWLWLRIISKRALWSRRRQRPQLEPLEERFLLSADSSALNVQSLYQTLPLSFEANQGQLAPEVQFSSSGPGYTLFLTSASAYLSLQKDQTSGTAAPNLVQMQLLGANANARSVGLDAQDYSSNYLIGDDASQWQQDVANFGSVKFSNIYQGIDLIYYGNQRQLEYDFVVAPGANAGAIALAFPGTPSLTLDASGDLIVHTSGGDLLEHAPVLYQMNGTQKEAVNGNYVIGPDNTVHFQVGAYNRSLPLVIDPVMSYATYLGGSGADNGQSVAVDAGGNVYITGFTGSTNFPTQTPFQGQLGGQGNVFVAKINPAGNSLVYSTFVGGAGFDLGLAIRVDLAGNAYVAGTTTSGNFPMKNAIQGVFGGGSDGFVFKLNPLGTQLVFSTYLGGSGVEFAQGLALDAASNVYVVGFTYSTNFPTVNALQVKPSGGQEAWVAKIASSGTSLIYSTYLGGSQDDSAQAVGVDSAGDAYVVGDTFSPDFPVKNSLQTYGGGDDAFVAQLNPSGSAILFSTYLGGAGDDRASSIRLDALGNIYVVGSTTSANYPTVNALQSTFGGSTDVFVTKLSPAGSSIVFSTYLGGSDVDQAMSLAIDSANNLYIVGFTASTNFPTVNPAQPAIGGGDGDAFLAKLSGNGSTLVYSSYFGGSDDDRAMGVAVDGLGNIYLAGTTASINFPTLNALQPGFGGSFDGFVIKLSQAPATQFSISAPATTAGNTFSIRVAAVDSQGNPAGDYTGTIHFSSSDPSAVLPANFTFSAADNGVHTFTGLQLVTVGTQSISAIDTVNNTIVGTRNGIVVTPMVSTFTFSGMPTATTAGTPNSVTITARDALGNVATGYTGTIHFTTSDPRGAMPADYQFTASDHGIHTFTLVVLKTPGTQSITVTDTALPAVQGIRIGITVNPSSTSLATHLSITMANQINSESPVSITITALDLTNALAADYRGTVHITSTDSSAILPANYTFTAADQGSHTFRGTFVLVQPLTVTVTDTAKASITGSTSSIRVNPPVGQLVLSTTSSSAQTGTPVPITITAQDILLGQAAGFQDTVHFTSNDSLAGLPADYTFTTADQGVHTFQVTFNTAGADIVTATDITNTTLTGSANVSVTSVPKAVLLTGLGQTVPAGTPQNVTITVVDVNGNQVPNYVGAVHFTSSDGQAVLPADYTFTAADKGIHTFQVTFKTIGSQSLVASDTANSALNATANVTVTTIAQILVLAGLGQTTTAGTQQTVTITLTDNLGNVATAYAGTVHFTSSDGQAVLPADYTFTAADQGKHIFKVTFKTIGSQSLAATDAANNALKASVNVTVTTAAQVLIITGLGQAAMAGTPQSVTVTLTDSFGNVATGYVGTVHFTSSDGQAVLPANYAFTGADQGTHTFQVTFKTTGSQSLNVSDTANNALKASVNVSVSTSAQLLVLSGLGQIETAGSPQSVTVTLTDSFGNAATGYVGTIHFASSDGQAVLPADYTFTAEDQGTHTFPVTFKTAGSQSLSVSDTANNALKASASVAVSTSAQLLVLSGLGQIATAGSPQSVTVTLTDSFGNVATGYVGMVHFTSSDGQAVLPADYSFTAADQGTHTFQVTFKTAGSQSLSVSDTANNALKASASVAVSTSAQLLVVSGLGQIATAGSPQSVTVTLTDSFGNAATGYVGTVHFASSDGQAVLPADYTFTAAEQGTHTFQVTFKTAGSQSLSVTDTANNALKASVNVSVSTSAQLLVLSGLGQIETAGSPQSVTVTLTDSFGNAATGYVGTIHFASSDGQAVLPADYTFTAEDQGTHTFPVTFKTAGSQSLSVTDTANNALKASVNVSVSTSAQLLVLSGFGQNATAGSPQSVTVTLTDSFGNVATGYVGTGHFVSSDGQAVLPADYSFTAADQGTHTFQVTFKTTGSQSLSVTDTANSALQASANVAVSTSAQLLVLSGLGQIATAGTPQSVTVTLTDDFGNVATGYVGTIHFTSSDGQAVLPTDYTFTAADQGKHTFPVTLNTVGNQSITVTDIAQPNLSGSIDGITVTQAQTTTAVRLQITGPSTIMTGEAATFTITALDASGHIATGYRGLIFWISSDSNATGPRGISFSAADQGRHTFTLTFDTPGAQSLSAFDQQNSSLVGTLTGIVVSQTLASAMMLSALAPSQVASGALTAMTVIALDAQGRPANDYRGTLHFQSSDPEAILPPDYTFTDQDQGIHVFTLEIETAAQQSVTITDLANPVSLTAELKIAVSSGRLTWVGKGQDNLWSDPQNWDGNVAPISGDTVEFAGSPSQSSSSIDLPSGIVLKSLVLSGSNFKIGGGPLTITDSIDASQATGANTIQADLILAGKVEILAGNNQLTLSGPIQLNANTLTVDAGQGQVIVNNTVTGSGGLILDGGALILAGTGNNGITGTIRVDAGVLQLGHTHGYAITNRLIVGSSQGNAGSASVVLLSSNQIADKAKVCVNATGLLNLAGQTNSFSALSLAGGDVETGFGTLTLDGDLSATSGTSQLGGKVVLVGNRVLTVATGATLNVSAEVSGSGHITKVGTGTLGLAGINSYIGTVLVPGGTFVLNGSLLNGRAIVQHGAVVAGSGTLGSLHLQDGSYQPGTSIGALTVQSGVAFAGRSLFSANLTPTGDHKLISSGQIILTGTILKLSLEFVPTSGSSFTIASAAKGIVGTFAGLPEGAQLTLNGVVFRITYHGGSSGNDVVLSVSS